MQFISLLLLECGSGGMYDSTSTDTMTADLLYDSMSDWAIAGTVFHRLATFLLLVVVLWGVNSFLREHSGSHNQTFFKLSCAIVLGTMGCLTIAYTAFLIYLTHADRTYDGYRLADLEKIHAVRNRLGLAYWVIYLTISLAAGIKSILIIRFIRSSQSVSVSLAPYPLLSTH